LSRFAPAFVFCLHLGGPALALAAGASHHAPGEIPVEVFFQAANFTMFVLLLYFILRKPVRNFFSGRQAQFQQAMQKATETRVAAERRRDDILNRLRTIESTADESIRNARAEAEELKSKMIAEAREAAQRLEADSRRLAEIELARARVEIQTELVHKSVALSQSLLKEKIGEQDQRRLQSEFSDRVGGAEL
jgi:F-type H+-transporting ATPase subunit b